jgi:fimbrial chaperone protein
MSFKQKYANVLGGVIVSAALMQATSALAFQVTPIAQDFAPSGRGASQSFQLSNDRDEQVTVTVNISTRQVDVDGNEQMASTGEFTVFPTEVVLPPHGTQVVRAKWVGDAAPKAELAYRLVAAEVPLKTRRDTPGASIYMTVRYVGSLYVLPKGARPNVRVISAKRISNADGQPKLEVLVENQGTAHTILDNPTLTVTGGNVTRTLDAAALDGNLPQENVLSQHQRRFVVAWPEGLPSDAALDAKLAFNPLR